MVYGEVCGIAVFKSEAAMKEAASLLKSKGLLKEGKDGLVWQGDGEERAEAPASGNIIEFNGGVIYGIIENTADLIALEGFDAEKSRLRAFSADGGFSLYELRGGAFEDLGDKETAKIVGWAEGGDLLDMYKTDEYMKYEEAADLWIEEVLGSEEDPE